MKAVSVFFLVVFLLHSCNSEKSIKNSSISVNTLTSDIETIQFSFQDASVPPDDHRSYSYILRPSSLQFVVDSYGTVLKDTTLQYDPNKWESICQALKDCALSKNPMEEKEDQGCSGGTGNSLTITFLDGKSLSASRYHCGGYFYGDLHGDVECFEKEVRVKLDPTVFSYD